LEFNQETKQDEQGYFSHAAGKLLFISQSNDSVGEKNISRGDGFKEIEPGLGELGFSPTFSQDYHWCHY
jgi:hypothetical protein